MLNRSTSNTIAAWLAAALITGALPLGTAEGGGSPAAATAVELMTRDLVNDPGKEVLMLTVAYPAAGASLAHRHDAQVFVYVLEGTMTMQVQGGPAVTLKPGDTFYEGPDDVHVVSANSSSSEPAKILVVMIKDKHKPVSRAVAQ